MLGKAGNPWAAWVGGLAVMAVLASSSTVEASPAELFGFGARSPALAGAGVSDSTDYDAVYINPAGLAQIDRVRVTAGALFGDVSLKIDGRDVGADQPTGFLTGFTVPIPLRGKWKNRVGAALALFVPGDVINQAESPFVGDPVFVVLDGRTKIVAMQGGIAAKLNDKWSAGAGVWVLAGLGGSINVSTDPSGRFATQSEQQLQTQYVGMFGTQYRPSNKLKLGAVMRTAARATYDITITNDLADSLPLTIPTVQIAGTAQFDPATVAVEASYKLTPSLSLYGQVQYQRWSAFPPPTLKVVESMPPAIKPNFSDTVVPRLAAEWAVHVSSAILRLRGGYFFAMSPAPEQSGRLSLLDNHRHVFAAGVGLSLPQFAVPLHINAWAQTHYLIPRRHTKDLDLYEPGEQIPYFSIKTEGTMVVGGFTVGIDL